MVAHVQATRAVLAVCNIKPETKGAVYFFFFLITGKWRGICKQQHATTTQNTKTHKTTRHVTLLARLCIHHTRSPAQSAQDHPAPRIEASGSDPEHAHSNGKSTLAWWVMFMQHARYRASRPVARTLNTHDGPMTYTCCTEHPTRCMSPCSSSCCYPSRRRHQGKPCMQSPASV